MEIPQRGSEAEPQQAGGGLGAKNPEAEITLENITEEIDENTQMGLMKWSRLLTN